MYRYVFDMSGWVYPLGHVHFDVFGVFDVIRRVYPPFHVDFAFSDVRGGEPLPVTSISRFTTCWDGFIHPKMLISKFPTFRSG